MVLGQKEELFRKAEELLAAMRVDAACRMFQAAEEAGYDADACAGARWSCYALLGDLDAAWRESDAISRRGRPDPHRFWDGRPFEGRHVLVRCLHGLGDTLQYLRYAPLVRSQAASLTIEAQPLLKSLVEACGTADAVITWGEREPFWDQQVEIVELPRIFRTTIETIPANVPYIRVPAVKSNGSGNKRVGLIWASGAYNPLRSIPLQELATIFDVPGISFFSFQAGEYRVQLAGWETRVRSLYQEGQSVLETAIQMQGMDLVITVDTMAAHLAGAMGLPVWTMLPFACDWRWMLDREDSPWYPTMRLFRQERPGDWGAVAERVKNELSAYSPARTK